MNILKTVIVTYLLLFLLNCNLSDSGESQSPELTGIELRSTSFRDATDFIYEADTLFISVGFSDADYDPDTLYLSISYEDGTLVYSDGIGNYALYDDSIWKASYDTRGLSTGTYSISLYALDKLGNKSNTLTKGFTIQTDPRDSVTTADVSINNITFNIADSNIGEPFRVNYEIKNNSPVTIDLIQVEFSIIKTAVLDERTTGIINKLAPGELREDIAKASVPEALGSTGINVTLQEVIIQFY